MKKILAVTLAVLMLLPMFASIALADFSLPENAEVSNVAPNASIEIKDTNSLGISIGSNVDATKLIDGDKSTGTNSPQGKYYSYVLNYERVYYFTDIVVACNGQGTLATGLNITTDTYNVTGLMVKVYYGDEVTYASDALNVSNLKEVTVPANAKGDRVEIYKYGGKGGRTEYMWEIETYAPDTEICSAQVENVASEAVFSATGGNANYWWAMDYKTWVDGDPLTGSHSPKGRNYSVWMHFPQEYLFSQIDLVCNTEGGAKLASGTEIKDRYIGNSMMQVLVYNYNEDLVWDSNLVDTSTTTLLSVAPYVTGAIIEIRFFNGNFGGGEYMYEVSAFAQSGEHVFEKTAEENPTCLLPGFQEYTCQCGKIIKQSVDATGFHKWSDVGEITKGASATENGVMSYPCLGCDLTKTRDIPSTGHNWDNGTVVPPACDSEGYTLYKCTDAECELSYKGNYVEGFEHIWGPGVVTRKPTVEEEGVITYYCQRESCNGEKYGRIRRHKYTDNTMDITSANVKEFVENCTTDFNTMDETAVLDGDTLTSWYGPTGSYVDIVLDRTYILTSGFFYASSNYTFMKVEFMIENPSFNKNQPESETNQKYIINATFNTGAIDNGSNTNKPKELDMLDTLKAGVPTTRVRITSIDPKWPNGSASHVHEIKLKAHKCVVTEEDYILSGPSYVAPKCGTNGKCVANCQVCGNQVDVVLQASADAGHNYADGSIVVDKAPTCVNNGEGHATCLDCKETVNGITVPATGEHVFTKDNVLVSAKCGFAGVGQKLCVSCNAVGSIYEIEPTGVHEREWTFKSQASYTAIGKTVYACIFCDDVSDNDPELGINTKIAEKIAIPDDLVTSVSVSKGEDGGRNTITFTYKINLAYLPEIEQTCDVRIITSIKDASGREASIESYGKFATNSYNAETGEFSVTIYPASASDTFEVVTFARLMNFRGIVYKTYATGSYSLNNVQ